MIKFIDNYLKIDTKNTSLIIGKHDNRSELVYYGKKLRDNNNFSYFWYGGKDKCFASNADYANMPSVMSSSAENAQKSSFAHVSYNGIFANRFNFVGAKIVDGFESPLPTARNKGQTVCLEYFDEISGGIAIKQYFTVFDDSDVIATHSEIINKMDCDINVSRLMSLQLDFIASNATVSSFDGYWCHERIRHDTELKGGRFEISSVTGISSGEHNPFMLVKIDNGVMGFNLVWSGNHKELVEVTPYNRIRIQTGMNDYQLNYPLKPGENLVSPEAVFTYATKESDITVSMHKFILNHIINPNFVYKDRPVLINNWEGTYFSFTGEKIYEIAKKASECGIEMLVLDDGWFGKRDDDTTSLGDWFDNVEKTGGLRNLADRIKALGMKFGLWVEPEMISPESELFKVHPEYAQMIPGANYIERRHQLCMDLCNPEVVDYLADTLIKLFTDIGVDYVKWDHNRSMSDVYSKSLDTQGRYFYDYYKNQSNLLRRITEACPDVLFESCASGGSRFDLGMMYFMPQAWGSDNTNAYTRLMIQEGTLVAYPQSTMGAHVAAAHSLPNVNIESRFNVAAAGAFGYELDITKLSDEELTIVSKQVAYYKAHRNLFQFGNYIRINGSIVDSDMTGWMLVSDDKSEAIAVVIDKSELHRYARGRFVFAGLDEETLYHVEMRPQSNVDYSISFDAYGDALMNGGFDFNHINYSEKNIHGESGRFGSRMFYISKIG